RAAFSTRFSLDASDASAEGRTLTATSRPKRVSRARYTSPIPPAPSGDWISYGPSFVPEVRAIRGRNYIPPLVFGVISPFPRSEVPTEEAFSELPPNSSRGSMSANAWLLKLRAWRMRSSSNFYTPIISYTHRRSARATHWKGASPPLPRQIEVGISNGKATPQAWNEEGVRSLASRA